MNCQNMDFIESLRVILKFRKRSNWAVLLLFANFLKNGLGGRRSPAVACWASDHWVASSNPIRGKFRLIIPGVCLAQFSLSNVQKRCLKHHHFFFKNGLITFLAYSFFVMILINCQEMDFIE